MAQVRVTVSVSFPWWSSAFVNCAAVLASMGVPIDAEWVGRILIKHVRFRCG